MTTPKKVEAVGELQEKLGKAKAVVLTDFRGLPTPEMNQVRIRLSEAGAELGVVKNTLLGIAAERVGVHGLEPLLQGPTAIAISGEKDIELARALVDYIRVSRTALTIKGAILGRDVISAQQVEELAHLPPRKELEARLAGGIQGPLVGFLGLLNSVLSGLIYTLDQRAQKMGEGAAPVDPAKE